MGTPEEEWRRLQSYEPRKRVKHPILSRNQQSATALRLDGRCLEPYEKAATATKDSGLFSRLTATQASDPGFSCFLQTCYIESRMYSIPPSKHSTVQQESGTRITILLKHSNNTISPLRPKSESEKTDRPDLLSGSQQKYSHAKLR